MIRANIAFYLAELSLVLLLACGDSSGKRDAGRSDGAGDAVVPSGADAASVEFTVAGCKADTCGAEATICGWNSSDAKYVGCLSDCEILGQLTVRCPEKAAALYACASLGAKVDCTTGKGTGCDAEEQALGACLLADGGAP